MNNERKYFKDKEYSVFDSDYWMYKYLCHQKKEFVQSKQLLRSGTAVIGALISESELAQSKPDFISKLHIAIKEANESAHWLLLLSKTDYITKPEYVSMNTGVFRSY